MYRWLICSSPSNASIARVDECDERISATACFDHNLPVKPNRLLIIPDRDAFVGAMHAIEVGLSKSQRQKAEHVRTQIVIVARVSHDYDQVRRYNRFRKHALDDVVQRLVT